MNTQGEWGIIGHEEVVRWLRAALESDHLSHAYLFIGPPQVGKRTLALALARALNCVGDSRPCGECRPCRLIQEGKHPDVVNLRGEGQGGTILIEQIRAIRREASLSPVEGRRKVYIICNVEQANDNAANALLKTLEEPPSHALFVLTTTSEELVMPTIVSRCQKVFLRPQSRATIAEGLERGWGVDPEQARILAHLSEGRVGKALAYLEDEEARDRRRTQLQAMADLLQADLIERFSRAEAMSRGRESLEDVLDTLHVWLSWWRDLWLVQNGLASKVVNADLAKELAEVSAGIAPAQVELMLRALPQCINYLRQNVNVRLALEWLMMHMPAVTSNMMMQEG